MAAGITAGERDARPEGHGFFQQVRVHAGGVQQGQHVRLQAAGDEAGDDAAVDFHGFQFIRRQGEAGLQEQAVDGRQIPVHGAGGAQIGGARGGTRRLRRARKCHAARGADGGEDYVQVFLEDEAEEVVQVPEGAAEEERRDAGGVGDLAHGEAIPPVLEEHVFGGFQGIGALFQLPRGALGAACCGFGFGEELSGWDDVLHAGRLG